MSYYEEMFQVAAVAVAAIESSVYHASGLTVSGVDHGPLPLDPPSLRNAVLADVRLELERQDSTWGPLRNLDRLERLAILAEEVGEVAGTVPRPDPDNVFAPVWEALRILEPLARRALEARQMETPPQKEPK